MEFSANAVRAGSDTKHDLMVQLELGGDAREVEIHSKVEKKFGEAIRRMWSRSWTSSGSVA